MNRILVLLAAHDGAQCIEAQIASVLGQRGVETAIVVGDDASTDATAEVVGRIAVADERVVLMPDRSRKGSASANFFSLIAQADSTGHDFVAFCDQDDVWYDSKLLRAVEQLRRTGAAGYSAAVLARWPDGRTRLLSQKAAQGVADYLFEGAGQGCTFVLRADVFAQVRAAMVGHGDALRAVHYHDWATYAIVRACGHAWTFDPRPCMDYLQHGGNDTGARSSGEGVKRRLSLIRSGWYRRQVGAIADLVLSINPADVVSRRWRVLSAAGRWRRLVFVARFGRRRALDRCIQLVAISLRWL